MSVWVTGGRTVLSIITTSAVTAVNMDMVIVKTLALFVNIMLGMSILINVPKLVVIMKVPHG